MRHLRKRLREALYKLPIYDGSIQWVAAMWHGSCSCSGTMSQRVLVVDDVPDVLMLATLSLEAVGFATITAHDGAEGVELAASLWPDLILCDVHMPKLDGFELLSAIRSNAATADIPVVFVSGDQSVCSRLRELPEAPNDFLAKPFTHADLVRAVTANIPPN